MTRSVSVACAFLALGLALVVAWHLAGPLALLAQRMGP